MIQHQVFFNRIFKQKKNKQDYSCSHATPCRRPVTLTAAAGWCVSYTTTTIVQSSQKKQINIFTYLFAVRFTRTDNTLYET